MQEATTLQRGALAKTDQLRPLIGPLHFTRDTPLGAGEVAERRAAEDKLLSEIALRFELPSWQGKEGGEKKFRVDLASSFWRIVEMNTRIERRRSPSKNRRIAG
jgi:hypothetical protein